jgi:hypothetical protein
MKQSLILALLLIFASAEELFQNIHLKDKANLQTLNQQQVKEGAVLNEDGSILEMMDDSNIQMEINSEQQPEEDNFVEPDVPDTSFNPQGVQDNSDSDNDADNAMVEFDDETDP